MKKKEDVTDRERKYRLLQKKNMKEKIISAVTTTIREYYHFLKVFVMINGVLFMVLIKDYYNFNESNTYLVKQLCDESTRTCFMSSSLMAVTLIMLYKCYRVIVLHTSINIIEIVTTVVLYLTTLLISHQEENPYELLISNTGIILIAAPVLLQMIIISICKTIELGERRRMEEQRSSQSNNKE